MKGIKLALALSVASAHVAAGVYVDAAGATARSDDTGKTYRGTQDARIISAPPFSMNDVRLIHPNARKAYSDLKDLFGTKDEIAAKCTVPQYKTLAVVQKTTVRNKPSFINHGATRYTDTLYEYGSNGNVQKVTLANGERIDATTIIGNYKNDILKDIRFEEVTRPAHTFTLYLHKNMGYLYDVGEGKKEIGVPGDLSSKVVDKGSIRKVLERPVVGLYKAFREIQERDDEEYRTYSLLGESTGKSSREYLAVREAISEITNNSLVLSTAANSMSYVPKGALFLSGSDGKVHADYRLKSSGTVDANLVNGYILLSAEHVAMGGSFTKTVRLKVAPRVLKRGSQYDPNVVIEPHIVYSVACKNFGNTECGNDNPFHVKNADGTTAPTQFGSVAYRGISSPTTLDLNCTFN